MLGETEENMLQIGIVLVTAMILASTMAYIMWLIKRKL